MPESLASAVWVSLYPATQFCLRVGQDIRDASFARAALLGLLQNIPQFFVIELVVFLIPKDEITQECAGITVLAVRYTSSNVIRQTVWERNRHFRHWYRQRVPVIIYLGQ